MARSYNEGDRNFAREQRDSLESETSAAHAAIVCA